MTRKLYLFAPIFCLLAMPFFCFKGTTKNRQTQPLVFTATLSTWKHLNNKYYTVATTTLTNNTPDTFELATRSCDLDYDCSPDSKTIKLASDDCLKNDPLLIKIPPYKSYIRDINLMREDNVKKADSVFCMVIYIHPATYANISNNKRNRLISEFIPKNYTHTIRDTVNSLHPESYILDIGPNLRFQRLDMAVASIILYSNPIKVSL